MNPQASTANSLPILYSFRRCPYAIRTRMALLSAGVSYQLREVVLKDKPEAMLDISSKATVPVLHDGDCILDESIDIIQWALTQSDPDGWQSWPAETQRAIQALIEDCESQFKPHLDGYKYAQDPQIGLEQRQIAVAFLERLNSLLEHSAQATDKSTSGIGVTAVPQELAFLLTPRPSLADICVFPFVRQFAHVDKTWFDTLEFSYLHTWLDHWLNSPTFLSIMKKHKQWHPMDEITVINGFPSTPLGS